MTEYNFNDKVKQGDVIVFKPSDGETEYEVVVDENAETIWASELEIAGIFGKNRTLINKHIRNIYKEGELVEYSTSAKNALVQKERDREVQREVTYYNLDVNLNWV